MIVYADTTFLISLHIQDRHSPEVWRRMAFVPTVLVTQLQKAEFAHAAFAHVAAKKLSVTEAENAIAALDRDLVAGVLRKAEVREAAYGRSVAIARQHGSNLSLRTMHSLHVACALELRAERFWTFDEGQRKLAEAAGLDTSDTA